MASHKDGALYGVPRPKKDPKSTISSTSSLSFASHLGALLTKPASKPASGPIRAPARPAKVRKDDLFSAHRPAKKRPAPARDDDDSTGSPEDATVQKHQTDVGAVDAATLHRARRRMEEKARLYAAMQRGDYVPPAGRPGEERGALIDFDRKWAEAQEDTTKPGGGSDTSSGDGDDGDDGADSGDELVDHTDELGRTRRRRRRSVERLQRQAHRASAAAAELGELAARPARPAGVIYGDAIQSAAFDPDEALRARIAAAAARRDRSPTPPEATHYDASKEVRSKGVGFYAFSGDKEGREREMEALGKEREETERRAREREERRRRREEELEERRRVLREKRDRSEADRFLKGLEGDLAGTPSEETGEATADAGTAKD